MQHELQGEEETSMRRDRPRGSLTEASHSREPLVPLSENLGSQDGHFLPSSKPSSGKPIVLPDSHVSYHDLINGSRTLWSPSLYVTILCVPARPGLVFGATSR